MKKTIILCLCSITFCLAQDGLVKSYYDNGKLKSEINFSDSVREGEAKFYYENGNVKEELTYVNGKVDGLVKIYNEKGEMKEMFNIEDGKREGPTSLFDSSGVYLSDINFKNGKLIVENETSDQPEEKKQSEKIVENKMEHPSRINKISDLPPLVEENLESDPAYYLTPEVKPEPVGGMDSLQKKLFYPALAKKKEIEGIVKILAFIDKNGNVTKAEVAEGIGYGCDEAARNLIYYNRFKPGLIRGKPVNVQMVIPVKFKLKK